MKKAAVIGLGVISAIHLDAIQNHPEITLAGVCDTEKSRQKNAPSDVPFFTDYKTMITEIQPDVVHICLPHNYHAPVTMAAGNMGVHVFCEKPVALNAAEAELVAEYEASHPHLHIGVCLQNRLNESVERLKSMIDSKEYGGVTGLRGIVPWYREREYYEAAPWRGSFHAAGGGCMINQAVHTLDLMYYLGGDVTALKAVAANLLDYAIEVEDTAAARLSFANGAKGLFFATVANYKNESVQLSVQLEKASFLIADNTLLRIHEDGRKEILCEDATLPGSKSYYGASHRKLISLFYQALENDSPNYIHARDALMSVRLIDAIQESSRTGKEVYLSTLNR